MTNSEPTRHPSGDGNDHPTTPPPQPPPPTGGHGGPPPWSGPSWPPPPMGPNGVPSPPPSPASSPPPPMMGRPMGPPPGAPFGSPIARYPHPSQPGQPPPPRRGGAGLGIGIILVLLIVMLLAVMMGVGDGRPGVSRSTGRISEIVVQPSGSYKIAMFEISGVILDTDGGGLFAAGGVNPVDFVRRAVERVDQDRAVKGVLMRVNSPGGGITASDIIYNELKEARARWSAENRTVKILILMDDLAASGGYYVSCQSDHIMAHPTTITGSIGVIMSRWNYAGLLDKLGIEDATITSADNKDIGSPFRPPQPMEDEVLRELVLEMHDRFIDAVFAGRSTVVSGLQRSDVAKWADGGIYTAKQAKQLGMIDSIGYQSDAIRTLSGLIDPNATPTLVRYEPPTRTLFGGLGLNTAGSGTDEMGELLRQWLLERSRQSHTPPILAIWPTAMQMPSSAFLTSTQALTETPLTTSPTPPGPTSR